MEVGGVKTAWLFADNMETSKKYIGQIAGHGSHKGKTGDVPYIVWIGAVEDGIVKEYQISTWRVVSKEKFDPDKTADYAISKYGKNDILFERAN